MYNILVITMYLQCIIDIIYLPPCRFTPTGFGAMTFSKLVDI